MYSFIVKNLIVIIVVPLFVLFFSASYVRFVINEDYLVSYEVTCDPTISSCFIGCEDELCTQEYFFSIVEKQAHDLRAQCGTSIEGCSAASACQTTDDHCRIFFCDPAIDTDCSEVVSSLPS